MQLQLDCPRAAPKQVESRYEYCNASMGYHNVYLSRFNHNKHFYWPSRTLPQRPKKGKNEQGAKANGIWRVTKKVNEKPHGRNILWGHYVEIDYQHVRGR